MKSYEVKFRVRDKAKVTDSKMEGYITQIAIHSQEHIAYQLSTFDGTDIYTNWFMGWQLESADDSMRMGFDKNG